MKIGLEEHLAKLPLPATSRWPEGVWDTDAFEHGTMSLIVFAPQGKDYQTSHTQDEIYVVMQGSGVLELNGEPVSCDQGDVLFVPAGVEHRFIEMNDLVTWAIFYGPEGGEEL